MTRRLKDTRGIHNAAPAENKERDLGARFLGFSRLQSVSRSRGLEGVTQRVPQGAGNLKIGRSQAASISSAFAGHAPSHKHPGASHRCTSEST